MRLNLRQVLVSVAVFTLLGAGSIFASPPVPSPSPPGEDHVVADLSGRASTLLAEIQEEAAELRLSADTLDTFTRAPHYSLQSHGECLHSVKDHINAIGERIGELERIRHRVLPWQQQATSEITPSAAQVAASTQAAMLYLRENQNRLFDEEYRNHLTTIADHAEDMKQAVDKFLDYERTQQKLERLKSELEIAGA